MATIEKKNSVSPRWFGLFPALVAFALYVRALRYEYVWDDLSYLAGFTQYQGLAGAIRAVAEPFYLYSSYYRPLAMLSYVVSAEPSVQHGINVALHAVNTVLVLYVARALMPSEVADSKAGLWAAGLGALLFAVHPVAVEPTVWVSGRFDTLMCSFVLGTCLAALGGEQTRRRLALVFVLFACAMGSKESAIGLPVALPFLLLLKWRLTGVDATQMKVQAASLMRLLVALALAVGLYIAARLKVIQTLFSGSTPLQFGSVNPLDKLNIVSAAVAEMARLIVTPMSCSAPLHPFNYEMGSGVQPQALAVVAAVLVLSVLAALKKPRLNFPLALLAALAMAWPVLQVLGIPNRNNIISDRYALAPLALLLAGLAAVAGAWVLRLLSGLDARGRRIPMYVGAASLLWAGALAAYSNATIPLWRDEVSFRRFMYEQTPGSVYAHAGYIRTLMQQERWGEARAEVDAFDERHPEEMLEVGDGINFMVILDKTGNRAGALTLFTMLEESMERQAVPARQRSELYGARAMMEADAGDWEQAVQYLEKATQLAPTNRRFAFQYARALHMAGQGERSDEVFERALIGAAPHTVEQAQRWRASWSKN